MQNQININRGVIRPIGAFNEGGELLKGYYGAFLGVVIVGVLLMAVAGMIPLAPLTPPLMCGIYLCLLNRAQGRPFNTTTLFKGFDFFGPSFIASLFVSLPMMIVSIVAAIIMQIGMGGINVYIQSLGLDKKPSPSPEEVLPVLVGLVGSFFGLIFLVVFVTIVIAFILRLLVIFAYPLIVEHRVDGITAVKLSVRGLMANFFGVIAMLILEILFIIAGVMFFYVGVLFVLPFIHAAWFCAYRRVFAPQNVSQFGQPPPPHYAWVPQGTSRVGRNLILGSLAMFLFYTATVSIGGFLLYRTIVQAIEKTQLQRQQRVGDRPVSTQTPTNTQTPTTKPDGDSKITVTTGGMISRQEISLPLPVYPPAAKAARAQGPVVVKITVDPSGKVIATDTVSGHALLRGAADLAARQATFKPAAKNREGILIYNFRL
jgi:TonB family protein